MLKALAAAIFLTVASSAAYAEMATTPQAETAAAPQPDPYESPIEQCIRDNAAKVEATISDINLGVDFLVNKVCAAPIADHNVERMKLVQRQNFERIQKMCDSQTAAKAAAPADAKPDPSKPVTLDYCAIIKNAAAAAVPPIPFDPWASVSNAPNSAAPPAAVTLASQLLLSLRAARKHREN